MPQEVLPFQYQEEENSTGLTALAGLPTYLEFSQVMGVQSAIKKHLRVRKDSQGWSDVQVVMSLIALNLAGGDCVDDVELLEADDGFCKIVRSIENHGLSRGERRILEKRWRKEKRRTLPSPSAVRRYLEVFHDPQQENNRIPGKAFIPKANEYLRGIQEVNKEFLVAVQSRRPQNIATLDQDATLSETHKRAALWSYKRYKAYQPLNTYWAEQDLIVHTEFRDGNVNAGFEQLRIFKEALEMLPEGVKEVYLRSDAAGYQYDLLNYCAKGENERFGQIGFAVGCPVTVEFKKALLEVPQAEWHPIEGAKLEWADVCYVTNENACSKNSPLLRYIATREAIDQLVLPEMEKQMELPFQTVTVDNQSYKVHGIVTNRGIEGGELIEWYHQRCGKSEEAHAVMKEDFAGGQFPSGQFGQNAAWWLIMILAMNLNAAMKRLALGESWITKRMKAIRFHLIHLPGRIITHAREVIIRLTKGHPSLEILQAIRKKILTLTACPDG